MRVPLKGLNHVRTKLASGTVVDYYYAWKGGPRLSGKPGSPEFIASYNEACRQRPSIRAGSINSLLRDYQESAEWGKLRDRTRDDYTGKILLIEKKFGTMPLEALKDRRVRGDFLAWRDELAKRSLRQADLAWTVLARVLSWGVGRAKIDVNPCKGVERLYEAGARRDRIWTDADEAAFLAVASAPLRLAMLLAVNTGQRQGDLLVLPWSAYDGTSIRLKQSKTGVRVRIPTTAALKAALDATKRVSPVILTNGDGVPWTADGFRSSWRKAVLKAKIEGLTFHDIRGTAVTRLFVAQCTEAEVATITGHTLAEVKSILDSTYLSRDYAMAEEAIAKLETRTENAKRASKRAHGSETAEEKA